LEVQTLLETKEEELAQTQEELAQAKEDVEKQYENMKIRIQFMYEHGSLSYLQILLSASSFSDMLNKAEYIEQVSAYDREMLEQYEQAKDKAEKLEKDLETQQEVLSQTKSDVEKQQSDMEDLIQQKQDEIAEYEEDIANKEEAIAEYEQMIQEQDDTIKALEASVAAAKAKKAQLSVSDNSTDSSYTYSGGTFCWPAPSYTRISDDYGNRIHPTLNVQQFHNGIDMAAPSGSAILAACDGTVVAATYNATMGNYVMIDHGGGLYTIYMHASALYVSTGQTVSRGEQIAAVGSTGRSTGPHLHFSVRLNGSYVNPHGYL
jgi:murein DD-endopeptidase MepM/ murein hydrolase activator NlpD